VLPWCVGEKKQPKWFREFSDTLNPFLQCRNDFYTTWLAAGKEEGHIKFKQSRGEARRKAWVVAKATKIKHAGKFWWIC